MKPQAHVALLSVLLAAGCGPGRPQSKAEKPQTVEVAPVQSAVLASTVALPAQLTPYESVDVFPKVSGFIQDIPVDRGSQVRKGQLLVRLTAPELGAEREQAAAAVRTAEAKYTADRATYERLAEAAKTPGVVAENDVNIARETAAADQGQVASARESLRSVAQRESYLVIRAPFDGVVTSRNLHPGALVGPSDGQTGGQPILHLADVRRLRLVIPVPAADARGARIGQRVSFTVPSSPGRTFEAPVARVADALDERSRTMAVELEVPNADNSLAAGEFVTVQWPVRRTYPTLQVPATAVANDQQRQFVIRVANGVTAWVDVTTGLASDGKIEVFGALKPGDAVVRHATDALQPETRVRAKPSA